MIIIVHAIHNARAPPIASWFLKMVPAEIDALEKHLMKPLWAAVGMQCIPPMVMKIAIHLNLLTI